SQLSRDIIGRGQIRGIYRWNIIRRPTHCRGNTLPGRRDLLLVGSVSKFTFNRRLFADRLPSLHILKPTFGLEVRWPECHAVLFGFKFVIMNTISSLAAFLNKVSSEIKVFRRICESV